MRQPTVAVRSGRAVPEHPTPQQKAGRVSARLREVDGLARHIERVVDTLPPLTEAQRARLAALLGVTPAMSTPTRALVSHSARAVVSPRC